MLVNFVASTRSFDFVASTQSFDFGASTQNGGLWVATGRGSKIDAFAKEKASILVRTREGENCEIQAPLVVF